MTEMVAVEEVRRNRKDEHKGQQQQQKIQIVSITEFNGAKAWRAPAVLPFILDAI